jgi:putative YhdH/YhfP family quinone oxidoreductase
MTFHALLARDSDGYKTAIEQIGDNDLPRDGEVLVDVAYSSLNYKDALAVTGRGKIVRRFPMVLGIDLAGTVVESTSAEFRAGDRIVGVGQGLGESEWGGYSQRQRVRANSIIPLPETLSFEEAMRIGTAGFTAMLCVMALEQAGIAAGEREMIVTGATGGVGSIAVMLLTRLGYRVAALTGRPELEEYLRELGATSIVSREELEKKSAPMQSERWAGGIDTVGGTILANAFAQTAYEGAIACCGMAASHELAITVWPLILRNVSLLGVSSIRTPKAKRIEAWSRLARDIDRAKLASLSRTEPLSRVFELSEQILAGHLRGRTAIDVNA